MDKATSVAGVEGDGAAMVRTRRGRGGRPCQSIEAASGSVSLNMFSSGAYALVRLGSPDSRKRHIPGIRVVTYGIGVVTRHVDVLLHGTHVAPISRENE